MLGCASHMLHLQVSHLKIPIHYIVYGKITPFTEQYATFCLQPFLMCALYAIQCMDVFCKGNVVKEFSGVNIVVVEQICSIIHPPETYTPLLIDQV